MTKTEYEAKIAELEAQIAELKGAEIEEEIPQPPHPRWKPKEGEIYYTVFGDDTRGSIVWYDYADRGTSFNRYNIGNVFMSEEAANFALERLKVLAEMREWAGEWDDEYVLHYSSVSDDITPSYTLSCVSYGEMRFATGEDVVNCIKAVGKDRLKKYYFMITEDSK